MKRYIARITVETDTPLAVGSGEKGLLVDRLIAKDANGLPYIPGTSLTGVLRHSFPKENWVDDVFGSGGDKGKGSRLILSSAHLVGEDGTTVIEGLKNIDLSSDYYSYFKRLPERDHVRMTHRGAADTEGHGKFDEELVHKGTRFVFEMELCESEEQEVNDDIVWPKLIATLSSPEYRIGAGTRKGFGKLKIISDRSFSRVFDLKNGDIKDYIAKSSSLNAPLGENWSTISGPNQNSIVSEWKQYEIQLKAQDFFLFGAGYGDEDADNKSKTEKYFKWDTGKPVLTVNNYILIPGTSVKGAISHRTAYHYNRIKNITVEDAGKINFNTKLDTDRIIRSINQEFQIDDVEFSADSPEWDRLKEKIANLQISTYLKEFKDNLDEEASGFEGSALPVAENNDAVKVLFGYAKNTEYGQEGLRGRVILDDIYLPFDDENEKVFNHVKIDRFTNGTIDGALFQEKAFAHENAITLTIWVDPKAFEGDNGENIQSAFESTLEDLKKGRLPLGGNSAKGHGIFKDNRN